MANRTSQIGRGQIGAAQIGSTTTSSGSESWSVAPSSGHTTGSHTLTATGTSTSWSGSPFSVTGGTGTANITSQSTSSSTAGIITINVTVLGTITLSDGVTTTTYDSSAVAPLVPTIGTATNDHNGTATVTFTPNADNGGATVTLATATGSLGDNGTSGGGSPIVVTVNNSHLGSLQTWTVTTTNTAGTSSASGATNSVATTSPPGTPTIGTATAGNASASVAFTPGITGGLTVTYTATSSPGGLTGSGGSSPVTVSGLTNGTSYTFTVVASNTDGSSSASGASSPPVTPQNTVTILVIAPYLTTDTIGTKSYQIGTISGGVLTFGSAVTTGFTAIPNITNGWWTTVTVVPNGTYGDFTGIARFSNINGSNYRAIELYSPPTALPVNLVIDKIAPFSTSETTEAPENHTVTVTIASPGVVTWTAHGLGAGNIVQFTTTGALPTGLSAGVQYFVVSPTTNTFEVSLTSGGSAINTSGSQSGTHTGYAGPGYQLYNADGSLNGGPVNSGIIPILLITNGYVAQLTLTPDVNNGAQLGIEWNGG
jgi:hypothetical protein